MKGNPVAKVKQNEDPAKAVPVEVLAESIVAISAGIRKLLAGPLNEKALHLLIQNAAPAINSGYPQRRVSIGEIRAVLQGIEGLEKTYIKKKGGQPIR